MMPNWVYRPVSNTGVHCAALTTLCFSPAAGLYCGNSRVYDVCFSCGWYLNLGNQEQDVQAQCSVCDPTERAFPVEFEQLAHTSELICSV